MPTTRATELAQVGSLVSADPSASTVTVSGSVVTNAGTAAAPAVVPTGDLNTGMFFPAADTIAFSEGGTEAMRIDSSGNVGIGNTNPNRKLDVRGSNAGGDFQALRLWNESANTSDSSTSIDIPVFNGAGGLRIKQQTSSSQNYDCSILTQQATASLILGSGTNTERLRIDSSGKLLLNTTSAANYIFNAIAKTTQGGLFKTEGLGARDAFPLACWHNATTGDNLFVDFNTETSITSRGYIDYNRASGLVRYGTTSDATLKNIIGDTSGDESLNILRNTKIRDFTWKDDASGKVNVGVIAQELYGVFKGAVSVGGEYQTKDENGNDVTKYRPWAVDKTAFSFHLVAGWQAHEKLIQELKTENDSLKARIAALEAA